MIGKRLEVVGVQMIAVITTFLTGIIVTGIYCLAPFIESVSIAGALIS